MSYRAAISKLVPEGVDPRHVEAYMRCEHGTLDKLSEAEFAREVVAATASVRAGGDGAAEALARSYGL